MRKNFLLALASLFLTLAAAEIFLRINPPVSVYMATRNIVQQTHCEPSPDPWISYVPRAGLVKPFRNREFNVLIKINSMNMRGREYSLEKPPGVRRIAAMGDSFVFGWGVENEEIFTEILEKEFLKNTEVLNFGVSGYAAYQELERLKKEALRFHPGIVLFFLYGPPEGYPGGDLISPAEKPPSFKRKAASFLEKNFYFFVLFQEARGVLQVCKKTPPQESGKQAAETEKGLHLLKELKDLGMQSHFIPVVIYIPVKQSANTGSEPEVKLASDFCRRDGIYFLDLTGPLHDFWAKERRSPYFRIDDHWNRQGHRAVAGILARYLKEKNLV